MNNQDDDELIIRQPKKYVYFGALFTLITILVGIYILFAPGEKVGGFTVLQRIFVLFLDMLFSFLGIFLFLSAKNWEIEIRDDSFSFTNSFGRTRNYKYDEITFKQLSGGTRFFHNGKGVVNIPRIYGNGEELKTKINLYKEAVRERKYH